MKEHLLQQHLGSDKTIQLNLIQDILKFSIGEQKFNIIAEKRTQEGFIIDFVVTVENEIVALIETKGGDINRTDFVRGLGQIEQYYVMGKTGTIGGLKVSKDFQVFLLFPSTILRDNKIDLNTINVDFTKFSLLEFNEEMNILRVINKKELDKIADPNKNNIKSISQYYFRDNRIFELYILLDFCTYKTVKHEPINRKETERALLRKLETPNNRNWRNAFITLSSLGLIKRNTNFSTKIGMEFYSVNGFSDFLFNVYKGYLYPYINEIFDVLNSLKTNSNIVEIRNFELSQKIREKYYGKDILFLTESDNRYISSFMNILRDDFGAIEFNSRNNKKRKIIYNPKDLNERALKEHIDNNTKAQKYIDKYRQILEDENV